MDFIEKIEYDLYRALIGRQMFCLLTGAVLDIETAVVVESADGGKTLGIVSPEGWAQVKGPLLAKYPNLRVIVAGKVRPTEGLTP